MIVVIKVLLLLATAIITMMRRRDERWRERPSRAFLKTMILLAALDLTPTARAIPVFDCDHPATQFKALDLHEPSRCPDPVRDFLEPRDMKVHLLQQDLEMAIPAYQCLVVISQEVTRCGFTSITYGTKWSVFERTIEIDPADCRRAVKGKSLKVMGKDYRVAVGETLRDSFFSRGNVDKDGTCKVEDFCSNNECYENSYEVTYVRILIKETRGAFDTFTGLVTFPSGVRGIYTDGILRDAFQGTLVWRPRELTCQETISQIYLGTAKVHLRNPETQDQDSERDEGTIVMIKAGLQYAGLILRKPISICGRQCWDTHVPGAIICLLRVGDEPIPDVSFRSNFHQGAVELQTQLGHLHIGTNLRVYQRFEAVQSEICLNERRILHGRLQDLSGNHNGYALLDLYGPGHIVHVQGAVAYIGKCVLKDADRATYPNCTVEVPVRMNHTILFADPLTWVLQDVPTIIPCNDITPVRWRIGDRWYCSTPQMVECQAPKQLNTTVEPYRSLGDFTEGVELNSYTPEQRNEYRDFSHTIQAREPVISQLSVQSSRHRRMGYGGSSLPGVPLSDLDLEQVQMGVVGFLFPVAAFFGQGWTVFMGVLFILYLFKLIVGCAIRAATLYMERGSCGPWMFAALWATMFMVIRAPISMAEGALGAIRRDPLWDHRRSPRRGKPRRSGSSSGSGRWVVSPPGYHDLPDDPDRRSPGKEKSATDVEEMTPLELAEGRTSTTRRTTGPKGLYPKSSEAEDGAERTGAYLEDDREDAQEETPDDMGAGRTIIIRPSPK